MKYIDAEKLKEIIDEKWKELANKNVKVGGGKWDVEISTYLSVLKLIDSLQQEQPEVDLEKEINHYFFDFKDPDTGKMIPEKDCSLDIPQARMLARHFYELGLNARKEE